MELLLITAIIIALAVTGVVYWVKTAPDEDIVYNQFVDKSSDTEDEEK